MATSPGELASQICVAPAVTAILTTRFANSRLPSAWLGGGSRTGARWPTNAAQALGSVSTAVRATPARTLAQAQRALLLKSTALPLLATFGGLAAARARTDFAKCYTIVQQRHESMCSSLDAKPASFVVGGRAASITRQRPTTLSNVSKSGRYSFGLWTPCNAVVWQPRCFCEQSYVRMMR